MIDYDAGTWGMCFARRVYGSVFPKAFVIAAPMSLFACIMHFSLRYDGALRKSLNAGSAGTSLLGGFFFILGFLVVFRSQQAYARWWEGGTLLLQLRGEWFNAASCIMAFSSGNPARKSEVEMFQHQLVRLISLLYASALARCSTTRDKLFELIDCDGMEPEALGFLQSRECHDPCEVVLMWIQRRLVIADRDKTIDIAAPMLSRVYNQLGNGIVRLSNARKISMCPIPYPLAQMITVMLFFHSCIVPIMCATTVEHPFWCGFLTFTVVISFWSINYIALELEMPFGSDPNDLPLQEMQVDMNKSLKTMMHYRAINCPDFVYQHDKHPELRTVHADVEKNLLTEAERHHGIISEALMAARRSYEVVVHTHHGGAAGKAQGGHAPAHNEVKPRSAGVDSSDFRKLDCMQEPAVSKDHYIAESVADIDILVAEADVSPKHHQECSADADAHKVHPPTTAREAGDIDLKGARMPDAFAPAVGDPGLDGAGKPGMLLAGERHPASNGSDGPAVRAHTSV